MINSLFHTNRPVVYIAPRLASQGAVAHFNVWRRSPEDGTLQARLDHEDTLFGSKKGTNNRHVWSDRGS
jgi:hypothetical protein